MPNDMLWQMRSAHFNRAQFFLDVAGCSDSPRIVNLISHQKQNPLADCVGRFSSVCQRRMGSNVTVTRNPLTEHVVEEEGGGSSVSHRRME